MKKENRRRTLNSKFEVENLAIVSIMAENVHETVHFYRDVLGLNLLPQHGHRLALDVGENVLVVVEGIPGKEKDESARFPALTFAVEDIELALKHLEDHDVETLHGIEIRGDTHWVLFHDPAGNLVELAQFGQDIHATKNQNT